MNLLVLIHGQIFRLSRMFGRNLKKAKIYGLTFQQTRMFGRKYHKEITHGSDKVSTR